MCNVHWKGQGNTFLCDCRTRLECPGGCGTWSKRSVSLAEPLLGQGARGVSIGSGGPAISTSTLGQAASFNSIQIPLVLGRLTALV